MKTLRIIAVSISFWSQQSFLHATEEATPTKLPGRMPSLTLISQAQDSKIAQFLASKGVQSEFRRITIATTRSKSIPEILITGASNKQALSQAKKKIKRKEKRKLARLSAQLAPLEDSDENYHTLKKECQFKAEELKESKGVITVKKVEPSPTTMARPHNMPSKGSLLTKKNIECILSSKRKKGKKEEPDPSDNYITLRKLNLPENQELKEINKMIVPVPIRNISDK